MGKSGKTNRIEPTELNWIDKFPDCAKLFQNAGWLDFFRKINGYNTEVSYKFAQSYKEDMIVFDTLKFKLTVDLVAEATGVKNEGEMWFKKLPFTFDDQRYLLPGITPDWRKGVLIQEVRDEWVQPIKILQSYITCEGRYAYVFKYHFRFLQHLIGESKMNLPFFLFRSLQKMSSRIKGHHDHTTQSIFHHGLIKLIISTVLQQEGKTWEHFLFWSGFQTKQKEQQAKKRVDKGQSLVRKLGQESKSEDKKEIKFEEEPEPLKGNNEPQRVVADSKGKYSLFPQQEDQPEKHMAPAETLSEEKIVVTEKGALEKEDIKVQRRSPITVLSEDEGYLLEEDEFTLKTEAGMEYTEKYSQEDKTKKPKKEKTKIEGIELATIKHQGKTLKMVKELVSEWRPKTRSKNKLRLNMKKLLNPRMKTEEINVLDDESSDEELKIKKEAVINSPVSEHTKEKRSLKSAEDSSLTQTKLSAVFLELKDEIIKEQQKKEIEVSYSENQNLIDETTPIETTSQENPIFHGVSSELLQEDEDIFRRLNVPWLPSEMQNTITGKVFDSDMENLQRTIKQYRHQMECMQETNDALVLANRRLREDLQEVNENYQELITVSKEALKRKRSTDLHYAELKQNVKDLQQKNEKLTRKLAETEAEQKRARKKAQISDGIALLVEAAKDL